ncbi:hypothetical protein TL16_g05041 [Triparma laevis f. inornata]|uniref:CWH43-like N-terminal domain-containing protein n=2 Tax=Triparma laevis TaxID=1534972 RepID=A0A9W6ZBA5_9STRA|nr:hypothetical protein TrLO_g8366 [Triparma laevis f. longispina]GMH68928.1 hypothetical protein TL16_g05041 [Triparma laevis f. inornata]
MVGFAITLGVATFAYAYQISIEKGWIAYPYYFLSSAINHSPASNVGSFGLSIALFCIPLLAFVRYVQLEEKIDESSRVLKILNKISVWSALISAVGGHGVAAWQASANVQIHLFFAGVFFAFTLFICVIQVVLDFKVGIVGLGARLRQLNAVLALGSLGTMAIQGLIILIKYDIGNVPRSWIFPMSVLELIFVGSSLGVYATFFPEFKGLNITLSVTTQGEGVDSSFEERSKARSESMNSV